MNGENIALFDLDGSLVNYDLRMLYDLQNLMSKADQEKLLTENKTLEHLYYFERPEWLKRRIKVISNQTGWWENLERLWIGIDIVELAVRIGFDIHILTKGPKSKPTVWKEKVMWCNKNIPWDHKITITQEKGLVYGKVLFDDYPGYIKEWLKWRPRGLVIMPKRPGPAQEKFKHPNVIKYDGYNPESREKVQQALFKVFKRKSQEELRL